MQELFNEHLSVIKSEASPDTDGLHAANGKTETTPSSGAGRGVQPGSFLDFLARIGSKDGDAQLSPNAKAQQVSHHFAD